MNNLDRNAAPRPLPSRRLQIAVLAGACLGVSAAGCARPPHSPVPVATAPTTQKSPELKEESREERIGRRLPDLRPGMTQHEVEDLIGEPNANLMQPAGLDGLAEAGYWCVAPANPDGARRLMILYYDTTVDPPQLIEVTGPHNSGG